MRDGSLKRRGRTTPQFRSVKKEKKSNKSFFVKFQNFLSVRDFFQPLLQTSLSVCFSTSFPFFDRYWSAAKACDLPDRRQFNGNCLPMKDLELPDCHSATPYIPPTSNPPLFIQKCFTAILLCSISNGFLKLFLLLCKEIHNSPVEVKSDYLKSNLSTNCWH